MATRTSFYSSARRYPLQNKPLTSPDIKETYQDIFNLTVSFKSLLRDLDLLFLGGTLGTPPLADDDWVNVGSGAEFYQDETEQAIYPDAAGQGTKIILRGREDPLHPVKFTSLIHSPLYNKEHLYSGICIRDPSTGQIYTIGKTTDGLEVAEYASTSSKTASLATVSYITPLAQWYRILNTSSACKFQFSADGARWFTLYATSSLPSFTFMGFWASPENDTTPDFENPVRCFSWRIENP
jgi:hypothetical protein